jgi:hypothetical protein
MFLALVNCLWVLKCSSKYYRHCQEKRKRSGEELAMFSQISTSLRRTGLSGGAPDSVRCPGWPGELAGLGKKRRRCGYNSPDCPVCTGLSGELNRARGQRSSARSTGDTWPSQRSDGHTRLSSVHRTVFGAPTGPKSQWSASPEKEGDHAPDRNCSCTVVHQTV